MKGSVALDPQVVLQVVIAFIVDAFVLQLQQNNLKKNLEQNNAVDDADCIEGG